MNNTRVTSTGAVFADNTYLGEVTKRSAGWLAFRTLRDATIHPTRREAVAELVRRLDGPVPGRT